MPEFFPPAIVIIFLIFEIIFIFVLKSWFYPELLISALILRSLKIFSILPGLEGLLLLILIFIEIPFSGT